MTSARSTTPLSLDSLLQGIEGVLWDMDGVLLDTEDIYTEATRRVLGSHADRFDWRVKEQMMGRDPAEAARILVATTGAPLSPEDYLQQKEPILLDLFRSCRPKPGAPRLVEEFARRGLPQVVATSSERKYFEAKTAHHPWFRHFASVVCGSDPEVKRHKPAPDLFLEAARRIEIPPGRCLVFEDSGAGVEAAKAAAVARVVAIPAPQLNRSLVEAADVVVDDFSQIEF